MNPQRSDTPLGTDGTATTNLAVNSAIPLAGGTEAEAKKGTDTTIPAAMGAATQAATVNSAPERQAATNVIRSQLNAIYNEEANSAAQTTPQTTSSFQDVDPYTHQYSTESVLGAHHGTTAHQWEAYHSAWQTYYQKYYEAYYAHQITAQATRTALFSQGNNQPSGAQVLAGGQGGAQSQGTQSHSLEDPESITKDRALFELRQKLLSKVRARATKIRKSRHFVPIVAAGAVMGVFLFLQYNQVLFATVNAYVSPGAIDPQNIVIDPSADTKVSSDPRLIIPKINVDVPVLYDVGSDYDSQMAAMAKGVAHFSIPGANAHPGEVGNTVLSGHSSNDLFDGGDYKFIFAQLEKLENGDTLYANYNGTRYTYVVTKKEVVKPTEVSKLVYSTTKPVMTLITCTPLGTSTNRLLVTAEQVSPDPATATASSTSSASTDASTIPGGSSPTLLEKLFGAK